MDGGGTEDEEVPHGSGSSAGRHDEVGPGEAGAAAGSSGAVLKAGGLGRQGADVSQVTGGHGAAARTARGDVAVQHLTVHHWLLALLATSTWFQSSLFATPSHVHTTETKPLPR